MFDPKFTPKFIPMTLSYSSQAFALKLSSIFSPKIILPNSLLLPLPLTFYPHFFTPRFPPIICGFPPNFPPDFPPIFSSQMFFPQVYSKHLPPIFAQRFSPIALRLLPPNFPLVFPQKMFSILIINFSPLLSTSKFFPHNSQNCSSILADSDY